MCSSVIQKTEEMVGPILESKNLELVDVEFVKEGKDWFLRVFIDKPGGIDITECGEVSEKLSEQLDKTNPINGTYFLEVSSPGAERPLKSEKDFQNHIGHNIYIKLYEPIDGNKAYKGILVDYADKTVIVEYKIKTRKNQVSVPFDKIAKARLAVTL